MFDWEDKYDKHLCGVQINFLWPPLKYEATIFSPAESVQNPPLNNADASGSDSRSLWAANKPSLPPVYTVPLPNWWTSFSRWLVGVGMKAMTLICSASETSHILLLFGACMWNHFKFSHHSQPLHHCLIPGLSAIIINKTTADCRHVEEKLRIVFFSFLFYLLLVPRGRLQRQQPLHQKVRHFCHPSTARCHGNESRLHYLYM